MHRTCFRGDLGCRFALAVCAQGDEGIGLRQRMLRRKQTGGAWRDGRCCAGGGNRWWCMVHRQMACREPPSVAQNDGRWLAERQQMLCRALAGGLWRGRRALHGELAGRWLAGSRRMLRRALAGGWWRVGRWHAERSTDVAREAGGWCAEGKERRHRQTAARNADGLCAQGDEGIGLHRRMLRQKQADGARRASELPTEGAQGLYLAR